MSDFRSQVSFGRRLSDLARAKGDAVALTAVAADGRASSLTWRELDGASDAFARELARRAAGPGTMVVVCLDNGLDHFVATLGAWKLGACVLPMSTRLPEFERRQILEVVGEPRLVVARGCSLEEGIELTGRPPLSELARDPAAVVAAVTPHPGKAMGSGGSTGRPKVIVDPRPWAADPAGAALLADVGFRAGQVQLVAGPLYHNAPFSAAHYGLFHEHRLVVMERFDADRALRLIEQERVSFAFLTPTMLLRMNRSPAVGAADLSSLEAVYHTAMACPEWLKREWLVRIGPERVFEAYGSTEAIGHTCIRGDEWLGRPGSVGRPQGCEVRILGDSGATVPVGEIGEVFMRDDGYPEPTYRYLGADPLPVTSDGFSSVGDLGWLDDAGYLYLADRRSDLILSGGVNIYPAEVEGVLLRHPAVQDTVVVGVADPEWGHRVHALVESVDPASPATAAELAAYVREHLHPSKAPKSFEFVTSLPRDESGKVRRSSLASHRASGEADARV